MMVTGTSGMPVMTPSISDGLPFMVAAGDMLPAL